MRSDLLGNNIISVKEHNLQVVLLSLLYDETLSRAGLAKRLHLSSTTITNLISELLEQGLVSERACSEQEGERTRPVGRPRTTICLVPDARFVVGIHVGVGIFRVALVNLRDEILTSRREHFDIDEDSMVVVDQMVRCVNALIEESQVDPDLILGVGVGLSGLVDFESGVNVMAPNLNWRNVPVKDILTAQLGWPVVVDNNVRCMALGETYFGVGRDLESLVFVYGRVGVGAGFISRGEVFRGSSMGAGEIGHTTMLLDDGEPCRCGKAGCLETLVSETTMVSLAERIARQNPEGILASCFKAHPGGNNMDCVFEAARLGDQAVRDMLAKRAYYLGVALANMVNLYNPELILLGGLFAQEQAYFIDPVIETVQQMTFGDLGKQVRIEATSFGWRAGVIGAAALALTQFFYFKS
ncbi:MAG: ROK family transcriptional regulator [Brevefilum sp.]